ncbi:MAG: ABC transporter ATP-binding protein [Actinomycetota bacterium]
MSEKDGFFSVHNLTKRFGGVVAVDDVSFSVQPQEMVGLIGPNGAGKTTLVRLIMGLAHPDQGRIAFKDEDIGRFSTFRRVSRGMAMTFQNTRPIRRVPTIANVMIACYGPKASHRGEWVKTVESRAMDALEFAGISDVAMEPAETLSQGELKRLEIARAIATEPELMLLDEPFAGLTQPETDLLASSLRRMRQGGRFGRLHSEGCAMIIIEHKLSALMRIVDRVLVLHEGRLIADGTPREVVANPLVIEAYLGAEAV